MDILKSPAMSKFYTKVKQFDYSKGNQFFELFTRECWIVTLLAPITIIIPSLLLFMAFEASSIFIGLLLFIIYIGILLPWVVIPSWFLLLNTKPNTKQRKYAYGWMGVIFSSVIIWVLILKFSL